MELDAIIRACRDATNKIMEACRRAWAAIESILRTVGRQLHAVYWASRRAHLIPRQHRDTIMTRKMRRYALSMVRRN
jgi:hypothetical protein